MHEKCGKYDSNMNAKWNKVELTPNKHDRQLTFLMSIEPSPISDLCLSMETTTGRSNQIVDHLPAVESSWLPCFNSLDEPIADHLTDDFFDDHPAWTKPYNGNHKNDSVEDGSMDITEIESGYLSPMSSSTTFLDRGTTSKDGSENISASLRWQERYNDLAAYKHRFGNCCVPSQWPTNPPLAQWVKRQRYQLKLQKEGHHSTMTNERKKALDELGFTWDPHTAFWEERLVELEQFRETHGHANVPTRYPQNPQLAIWAKCQRRQMKIYVTQGPSRSNMTLDRIRKLQQLGFIFCPRGCKQELKSPSLPNFRRIFATSTTEYSSQKSKMMRSTAHLSSGSNRSYSSL